MIVDLEGIILEISSSIINILNIDLKKVKKKKIKFQNLVNIKNYLN
jgi:hypothetical protein